jgi:hypothetical protein
MTATHWLPRAGLLLSGVFALAWSAAHWLVPGVGGLPEDVVREAPLHAFAYYAHSVPGSVAMLAGALQLAWLPRPAAGAPRARLHRSVGRIYGIAALLLGVLGFAIAGGATGGYASHFAFRVLAVSILVTTLLAWHRIRRGQVEAHVEWITRSYAFLFTFVTFRIWLVVLPGGLSDPEVFTAAAWWSGFSNLAAAEFINTRRRHARLAASHAASQRGRALA